MSSHSQEFNNSSVSGSVIQRTLIPQGLNTVLSIATVPVSELGISPDQESDPRTLAKLTSEILGISIESLLDETHYEAIGKSLANGDLGKYLFRHSRYSPYTYDFYEDLAQSISEQMQGRESREINFVTDALRLMANPTQGYFPVGYLPEFRLSRGGVPNKLEGISIEALQLGMACVFSAVSPDERVIRFTNDVKTYDIPAGQSPAAKSDSLLKLIETSKKVCLAPLAAGGTIGITHLTQGALVQALLCTGTGAGMTLILIGTISVADLLVRYLLQKRSLSSGGKPKIEA